MEKKELIDAIQQLDEELTRTRFVDEDAREHLQDLVTDVQALLDQPDSGSSEAHESARDRARDAVTRFEKEHPTLTAVLARVSDAIGRLAH